MFLCAKEIQVGYMGNSYLETGEGKKEPRVQQQRSRKWNEKKKWSFSEAKFLVLF